ncbi:Glutathione hydrolase 1 proenzyme [Nymphon striatum]|nr:Glutathione hydrolase 1 proenzyme [Nymphon striatum]
MLTDINWACAESSDLATNRKSPARKSLIVGVVFVAVILIILIAAIAIHEIHNVEDTTWFKIPVSSSKMDVYPKAAIVGGGAECSGVGKSVLQEGGHAVDAAIAVGLCLGVVIPYSLGLSGGHFSVIYDRKENKVSTITSREVAPLAASRDMYKDDPKKSLFGGMSAAVPGELKGYWEAHKKYGRLPWKRLFDGAIDKARNGFKVHPHYAFAMESIKKVYDKNKNSSAKHLVINQDTGEFLKLGDVVKQPQMAETLEAIALGGVDEFYLGDTGSKYVKDVRDLGGILTMEDLKEYKVRWKDPLTTKFKSNMTLYTMRPPSSGALIAYILNIMEGYNLTQEDLGSLEKYALTEHRLVEAEKFAYALRTKLGDEDFVDVEQVRKSQKTLEKLLSKEYAEETREKITDNTTHEIAYYGLENVAKEDFGTGHLAVVDEEGNAVSLTATLNTFFGSKNVSSATGILIGNTMDDFSTPGNVNNFKLPPSQQNFIEPKKRPQSSMSPCIIIDEKGDVRLAIGAAGGAKISTAVALVTFRHLWLGRDLKQAIDEFRLHHQLYPNTLLYEEGYPENVLELLRAKNHTTNCTKGMRTSVVQAISRDSSGTLYANSDHRKKGFSNGY